METVLALDCPLEGLLAQPFGAMAHWQVGYNASPERRPRGMS